LLLELRIWKLFCRYCCWCCIVKVLITFSDSSCCIVFQRVSSQCRLISMTDADEDFKYDGRYFIWIYHLLYVTFMNICIEQSIFCSDEMQQSIHYFSVSIWWKIQIHFCPHVNRLPLFAKLIDDIWTFACIFSAAAAGSDSSDDYDDLSQPKKRKGRYVFLEI